MSQLIDPTLILFKKYYYCFKRWSYSTPFPICRSTGDLSTRQYLPTYSKMTIGHSIILTNPIDLEIAFISCHICLVLISRHICLDVISHPVDFDVLFPQSDNTFISKTRGKTWARPGQDPRRFVLTWCAGSNINRGNSAKNCGQLWHDFSISVIIHYSSCKIRLV